MKTKTASTKTTTSSSKTAKRKVTVQRSKLKPLRVKANLRAGMAC